MPAVEAVEALIRDYHKLVFHTIYGLTGDWEESQDLTQDTFHQALRSIDAARAASGEHFQARAWLLRIALNTVRMQRRRRKLFSFIPFSRMPQKAEGRLEGTEVVQEEQAVPVQPVGFAPVASRDLAEQVAEQELVQRTLAKLPEQLRECLLLSIVGGLSTAQIADLLSLNEAAVRQRLSRARKQFQRLYRYESGEMLIDTSSPQRRVTRDEEEGQVKPLSRRLSFLAHPPGR
ncbi:RNA polymerase sigma factor (sigma-70 family) [Thermosporothrix hazakensis]|jgi:RNA polymerase sigma-70 factor (ECF subfamily)|uniref:RNA polymerase sigma factor (Sigma-70 family) n=2 Tax=Thermosporothrix TaxID=768650 RepID=A0A326UFA8_THEHA|nr:sigma-70 family RNA polymerase sigma factor [Thermosporothrix hazakensis]PZW36595.1 RNA polymerase sigma factor (sigma-70 family) [Thermosporothrix hazakensis]